MCRFPAGHPDRLPNAAQPSFRRRVVVSLPDRVRILRSSVSGFAVWLVPCFAHPATRPVQQPSDGLCAGRIVLHFPTDLPALEQMVDPDPCADFRRLWQTHSFPPSSHDGLRRRILIPVGSGLTPRRLCPLRERRGSGIDPALPRPSLPVGRPASITSVALARLGVARGRYGLSADTSQSAGEACIFASRRTPFGVLPAARFPAEVETGI